MIDSSNLHELSIALLSGLLGSIFGAVIGGLYSYKGAMDATKTQINYLYDQEKEKRRYEGKHKQETMFHSLLSESKENLNLSMKWQTSHSKSILSTETWSVYKGRITSLPPVLQEKLIRSYTEINATMH
jgi:hypothetical protein